MSWIILLLAGFFEIAWAIGLKLLDGFEKPFLLIGTLAAVLLSMLLLSFAMKHNISSVHGQLAGALY